MWVANRVMMTWNSEYTKAKHSMRRPLTKGFF